MEAQKLYNDLMKAARARKKPGATVRVTVLFQEVGVGVTTKAI